MTSARQPHLRRAVRTDLDALLELEHASFDHDRVSRAQFRRHLASASARVLVTEQSNVIVGSALLFFRRGTRCARLYSIAVSHAVRGRGVGAALLAAAEREARARDNTAMRLEVRVDNTSAMALYERRGYRRGARLPGFYENGADAWRYEKMLK